MAITSAKVRAMNSCDAIVIAEGDDDPEETVVIPYGFSRICCPPSVSTIALPTCPSGSGVKIIVWRGEQPVANIKHKVKTGRMAVRLFI